ncbi:histidine phosphatase family protein [Actinobacillus minor]|uniref:histidine phosphatase family protein n=1 Tax=Actinobacillus minor TaxID=51047 RepID=UPI0023F0DDB9|nr:histidine phosphatase family protein [Actinobacillus minor]MDD6910023.1 histidine phosphatase family protein [Actinobacillus minor]MDY4712166.1 histidine phosphatase family protein [Actinobacillus minor]
MALNIYLVRHGKTVWNTEGRLQGSGDSPLVEEGIEGAKKAGKALQKIPFAAAYSSMQKRAQDTANYILAENQHRNIPHFHHKGLNEFDFGSWEGTKSVDLYENDEYWVMKKTPAEYKAETNGGETYEQLYQRALTAFNHIAQIHQDHENVLIVAHGMTLTVLTAVLKGLHWSECRDETKHSFVINTAINIAQVENGQVSLIEFNNVEHLA